MAARRGLVLISFLVLASLFCSVADFAAPTQPSPTLTAGAPAIQTEVAPRSTQASSTLPPGLPSALTSAIAGSLSYPVGALPPMRVTAFDISTNQPYYVDTALNQPDYQILDLPAGTYYVVAYSLGGGGFPFGLAGAYTAAVPCGLTEACTGHKLLPVVVVPGQPTTDIRPADWYGNADLPPVPGAAPPVGSAVPPVSTVSAATGAIMGSLSFPPEFIPSLAVVAYQVGGSSTDFFYTLTKEGQGTYSFPVVPGDYYVVAYTIGGSYAGAYTRAVPCGLEVGCTDHALIPVTVGEGAAVPGIDPGDWGAPAGSFPPYPLP